MPGGLTCGSTGKRMIMSASISCTQGAGSGRPNWFHGSRASWLHKPVLRGI